MKLTKEHLYDAVSQLKDCIDETDTPIIYLTKDEYDTLVAEGTVTTSSGKTYRYDDDAYYAFEGSSSGGSSIEVDDEISSTSENPVQNKVIKAALDLKQDTLTAGDNITIDPVTNVISATAVEYYQPLIYSTDEREVGVWTDGKPLYQKTFIVDNPQAGGQTYNLNISNLEKVVEQFGTWTRRWESYGSISSWTYNINAENEIMPSFQPQFQVLARARDTDGTFYIYYPTSGAYSGAVLQVRLTIQYTKTTDTAGSGIWTPSGVPAVHYSTDEHVIGTWIDGGTLYEKTITASISNRVQWIDTGVDNTSTIVYSEGFLEHSGGIITLASADPDGQAGINTFIQSIVTTGKWSVLYRAKQEHTVLHAGDLTVTIRYTKSS